MRRRLLLNLLPRPLLILWVQSDLVLVHCPSINRDNLEGETNKQANKWRWHVVDGGVSPPVLLVLNLTQLKSQGIRLVREAESCKAGLPNDQTRTVKIDF